MALILYIVVVFLINSVKTEDVGHTSEDITKILQKLIEQIEAARRNKENVDNTIGSITKTESQIFSMKDKSDFKEMTKNLSGKVNKNVFKSPKFLSSLEQNLDIMSENTNSDNAKFIKINQNESKLPILSNSLENLDISESTNSDNVPSLESMINTDESTLKQQAFDEEHIDDIVSTPTQRRANLDINESKANHPKIIIDQITHVNRNVDETQAQNPDTARMLTSKTDYSPTTKESSVKKLNGNFRKVFKKIREINQLHKKEQKFKLVTAVPQQLYIPMLQRDVNMARKSFSETIQILPRVQEPFFIERNPWLQEPHPQNMLLKPPSFLHKAHILGYPRHGHQFQVQPVSVPRIQRMFKGHVPIFMDKISKNLWSFL